MMKREVQIKVLEYFNEDAVTTPLYRNLLDEGYDKPEVQKVFLALKNLGFITQTNARSNAAATYCITKIGRKHLDKLKELEPA